MQIDPTSLPSAIMQIIGAMYAIFIAVAILGIQTSLTILSSKDSPNPLLDEDSTKKFVAPIGKFQIVHKILAYFVFLVEFLGGAYMYYKSDDPKSLILLFLYVLFVVAILYIVVISYYITDYLLSPITHKEIKFNFDVFGCVGKWDLLNVGSSLACLFITICIYPIVANRQNSTVLDSVIITILLGVAMYLIAHNEIKENKNQKVSKQNNEAIQTETRN